MQALTKLFDDEPLDHPDASSMLRLDEKSIHAEPNVTEMSQSSETEEQASTTKKSAKNWPIHSMMKDAFNHFSYYFDYLCYKIQEIIYYYIMLLLICCDDTLVFNEDEDYENHETENVDDLEKIFDERENKEGQATLCETKFSNSAENLFSRRNSSSDESDFLMVSLSDVEDFAN